MDERVGTASSNKSTFGALVFIGAVIVLLVVAGHRASAPSAPMVLKGYPAFAATVAVDSVAVHEQPSGSSRLVARLARVNENKAPQTFLVLATKADWYRVQLPVRPNGSTGWVASKDVKVTGIHYALVVHLRSFGLDVFQDGRRVSTIPIGVGTQNTPTPSGLYYIKEAIRPPNQNTIYGHYVLGLSGFSNVLTHWPDGGVIGIHGTNSMSSIGRRVSHGCIRMSNANIERLVKVLPLGTPVRIVDN